MARLQERAAKNGLSIEEQALAILRHVVATDTAPAMGLGQRLAARFRPVAMEFELPARSLPRSVP